MTQTLELTEATQAVAPANRFVVEKHGRGTWHVLDRHTGEPCSVAGEPLWWKTQAAADRYAQEHNPGGKLAAAQPAEIIPRVIKPADMVLFIPTENVRPFALQPREFTPADEAAISELADDIKARGQDTPAIVRKAAGGEYELIAGERRLRACKVAGLPVLAIDRGEVDDVTALEIATAENAHRADLNPLDVARNIDELMSFGRTQEKIAKLLGKSQEWVSQTAKLRRLPGEVQDLIRRGDLTRGHAVQIARFSQEPKAALFIGRLAADRGVSVRELEAKIPFEQELRDAGLYRLVKPQEELFEAPPPPSEPEPFDRDREQQISEIDIRNSPDPAPSPAPAPAPAAQPTPQPAAAAPVEKPGFLKTASEKAAEKAAARSAAAPAPLPDGWLGKPVTAILPAAIYERVVKAGSAALPALTTFCDLAALAAEYETTPAAALEYLRRFFRYCHGDADSNPAEVLQGLESPVAEAPKENLEKARLDKLLGELARLHLCLVAHQHPGLYVTAFDPDRVTESNMARQAWSPADIGLAKATLLVSRLNAFYGLDWASYQLEYGYAERFAFVPDIVITAVDSLRARADIFRQMTSSPIAPPRYWLDLGNSEETGQVVLGEIDWLGDKRANRGRLRNVLDLFPDMLDRAAAEEPEPPSCNLVGAIGRQGLFINRWMATVGAEILWRLFREGGLSWHGAFVNAQTGRVNPIPVQTPSKDEIERQVAALLAGAAETLDV